MKHISKRPEVDGSLLALMRLMKRDYDRHAASCAHRVVPALATYRFGRWAALQSGARHWLGGKVYGLALMASEVISGVYLARETEVGDDLHFVHGGGINIHPDTVIGHRVGIMQGVTLGTVQSIAGCPIVEDDVFIGANATVLGPVRLGAKCTVAANSLVLQDVPAEATAIGVPARIVRLPAPARKPPSEGEA